MDKININLTYKQYLIDLLASEISDFGPRERAIVSSLFSNLSHGGNERTAFQVIYSAWGEDKANATKKVALVESAIAKKNPNELILS